MSIREHVVPWSHRIGRPRSIYQMGGDDRTSTHAVFEAGLRPRADEVDLTADVLADFFAAAFGALAPVAAFFAGARLEAVVVFFAWDFLTVFALVVLAAGTFAFVVVAFAVGLAAGLAAGFFLAAVVDFAADLAAGFLAFVVVVDLVAGLAAAFLVMALAVGLFSLAEVSALTFGASFTLPLTPLGSTKVPFSAPVEMALAS